MWHVSRQAEIAMKENGAFHEPKAWEVEAGRDITQWRRLQHFGRF